MISEKLTNAKRERIRNLLLARRFGDTASKLVNSDIRLLEMNLANEVYGEAFTKKELELMASLPEGWLGKYSNIAVSFAGEFTRLYFDGPCQYPCDRSKDRPLPGNKANSAVANYDATHPLTEKYRTLDNLKAKHKKEWVEYSNIINSTLGKYSTTKQLVDAWPEVEPFVVAAYAGNKTVVNLPAIDRSKLNQIFDLPVAA